MKRLYAEWELELSSQALERITAYVDARHTNRSTGTDHSYRFEDTGLDLAEHRALVAGYQERFDVPSEV